MVNKSKTDQNLGHQISCMWLQKLRRFTQRPWGPSRQTHPLWPLSWRWLDPIKLAYNKPVLVTGPTAMQNSPFLHQLWRKPLPVLFSSTRKGTARLSGLENNRMVDPPKVTNPSTTWVWHSLTLLLWKKQKTLESTNELSIGSEIRRCYVSISHAVIQQQLTTYAELWSSAIFCFTLSNNSSSLVASCLSSTAPVS